MSDHHVEVPAEATRLARERIIELVQMVPDKPLYMALHEDTVALALQAAAPSICAPLSKALEEAEDRYESCDNCERPSREEDLKVIWCREPESGEQVDARICLVCRLEVERDQAAQQERERIEGQVRPVLEAFDLEIERYQELGDAWDIEADRIDVAPPVDPRDRARFFYGQRDKLKELRDEILATLNQEDH